MKKLILTVLACSFACAMQAASMTWSTGALKTAGINGAMTGTALFPGFVYCFLGADNSAAKIAAAGGANTWQNFVTAQGSAGNELSNYTKATASNGIAYQSTASTQTFTGGTSFYLVIFDGSSAQSAGNYMVTTVMIKTLGSGGSQLYAFGTANGGYVPSVWSPIPEPATLALMGIGLAVVGLRRKFRKAA